MMKYTNLYDLSFNKINVFLTAAESTSFNAAAQKLNYSQSMVSKNIAELEESLGLILFIRRATRSFLTPAGKALYATCKQILNELEEGIDQAQTIQTGQLTTLTIGNCSTGTYSRKLEEIVLKFCEVYPSISVQYDEYSMSELIELGKDHKLDIIVTARHDAPSLEQAGYSWKKLDDSCLALFVPRSNHLFERKQLDFSDLAAEDFIVLSPVNNPNYINLLTDLCEQHGFTPRVSSYINNARSFVLNLLKGDSIALADSHLDISHKDIKMFPLEEYPSGSIIAWYDNDPHSNVNRFLTITDQFSN